LKPTYIVEDILRELYLNATPPTPFDSIDKNRDNWYWDYCISAKKELEIIEKHLKNRRLTKLTKQMIRNAVFNLAPKNI
jgi:hypothetical protein